MSTSRTAGPGSPPSPGPGKPTWPGEPAGPCALPPAAHTCTTGAPASAAAALPELALDFRGQGGYVVAPPSRSAETGRCYEVISHQASDATVDWQAIRRHIVPEPEHQPQVRDAGPVGRPREVGHLAAWLAGQQEGNRNAALFWAATRACEAGDYDALAAIARAARGTGLTDREITATVRSARRTAGRPCEPAPQREAG